MQIKKWDMRQRKVLMQYSGHFNDYSVIPIHVNEAENLLYAGKNIIYFIFEYIVISRKTMGYKFGVVLIVFTAPSYHTSNVIRLHA